MSLSYISLLFFMCAYFAPAWSQSAGVEALSVEDQEILVEVAKDGSYKVTEKTTLSALDDAGREKLALQRLTVDLSVPGSELLEAGVVNGHESKLVDLATIRRPASGEAGPIEIPFGELEPESLTWTKTRRAGKAGPGGLFNMDFIYGFLRLEKKGEVRIVSETPLYFQANDPRKILAIDGENGGFELKIRLTEPVLSVGAETLRVSTPSELKRETPRVQVSNVRDWEGFARKIGSTLPGQELPPELEKEADKLRKLETARARAEKGLQWIGETFNVLKTSQPETGVKEALAAKEGDVRSLALVAQSLLKASGVECDLVLVGVFPEHDARRYLHEPINGKDPLPSANYFNHWAVRYRDADKWVTVDPARGLASAEFSPYYFNHAWAISLGAKPEPYRIELPSEGYGSAAINTVLTRNGEGEYGGQTQAEFRGELANFLRDVFFKEGENALRGYLEAFASVTKHRGFTYRKLDFFDRSAKNLRVELTFATQEPKGGPDRHLIMPPHYLPIYSRPAAGLRFPAFPMEIVETTFVKDAFVAEEEKFDCSVLGPLVTLWRQVENKDGEVAVRDHLTIPSTPVPGENEDDQARLSLHASRLSQCAKDASLIVSKRSKKQRSFDDRAANITEGSLTVQLRKTNLALSQTPQDADLWRERGRLLQQLGQISGKLYLLEHLREAELAFKKAMALKPGDPANMGEFGLNALYQGELGKAIEALHKLSALENKSYIALLLGGLVSKRTEKLEIAVSYFASAAVQAYSDEEKYNALSEQAETLCRKLQRCSEALPVHDKILLLRPKQAGRIHAAAQAYARAGNLERAVELERKAAEIKNSVAIRDELIKDLVELADTRKDRAINGTAADFRQVLNPLREAYKLDGKNTRVLSAMIDAYAARAEAKREPEALNRARRFLNELKEAAPEDDAAALLQGQNIEMISKALEVEPKDGDTREPSSDP